MGETDRGIGQESGTRCMQAEMADCGVPSDPESSPEMLLIACLPIPGRAPRQASRSLVVYCGLLRGPAVLGTRHLFHMPLCSNAGQLGEAQDRQTLFGV